MWSIILQALIVSDLCLNFFFHIVQLRRYCCQQNALRLLGNRFGGIESQLADVDRRVESLSTRRIGDLASSETTGTEGS